MILHLNWEKPFELHKVKGSLAYATALDKIPGDPGIYIFGRQFGKNFEALYVGKAENIRRRIKGQLNSVKLMDHLRTAKSGKRILLVGALQRKQGQKTAKCLALSERALIRHFLSEGHDLVNIQGARIKRHELRSGGDHLKKFIPGVVFTERRKGE